MPQPAETQMNHEFATNSWPPRLGSQFELGSTSEAFAIHYGRPRLPFTFANHTTSLAQKLHAADLYWNSKRGFLQHRGFTVYPEVLGEAYYDSHEQYERVRAIVRTVGRRADFMHFRMQDAGLDTMARNCAGEPVRIRRAGSAEFYFVEKFCSQDMRQDKRNPCLHIFEAFHDDHD